jgi:hypothetical protein
MADFDSPWKELLGHFFEEVIAFLLPLAHAEVDWSVEQEHLETEMRKLLAQAEVGPRRFDTLVKVTRKGSGDIALIHVELQMQQEADFERRMFVYNYKGSDRYNLPVVSLAILGDDNAAWRPECYVFDLWGCQTTFRFVAIKLLDWHGREDTLEAHPNPFAVFILAHLMTLATRGDDQIREKWKSRLAKNFLAREMALEDRKQWFRLLDWLMQLPEDRNREVWKPIYALEDPGMSFLSFYEREEKRVADLAEARGETRGEARGLIRAVRALMTANYGAAGLALMPRVEGIEDNALLDRLVMAAEAGASVEQLTAMLP